MIPALDERNRIRAAMERILDGTPQNSNGALTIVALAQEAGVPRNALTQRHTDLRNDFYEQVKQRGATPDVETRLRQIITNLKQTIANKNEELEQLRADVPALIRVVNQLTLENQQLREELGSPRHRVVPLPSPRKPS
ncbi:hypothetical protein [Actinomadura violacea]|uniref:Uncharacterized protein n=1 Tax=Actinomadura violacea TaxID=2819934 RepID=A0ABS3SB61_9ACTN|nr:hypothetical protein [Actinomadura violacea]MBO2466245.1 hypothetical protein [Actinomadura violacea]